MSFASSKSPFVELTDTGRRASICGVSSACPITACGNNKTRDTPARKNGAPRTKIQIDDNLHRCKMRCEITMRVWKVSRRRALIGILVIRLKHQYE